MIPNFEPAEENHEFQAGEEVYLIDKNKIDIYKAKVEKVLKKGFTVQVTDHESEPQKVLSTKRLLLPTPANNEIYEKQEQLRKEAQEEGNDDNDEKDEKEEKEEKEEKGEDEPKEEETNANPVEKVLPKEQNKKIKKVIRKKKVKKPLFDQQFIIKTAWHNGIHEVDQFHRYIKKNIKKLVAEFEKYYTMMNAPEHPPFSLGGGLEEKDITSFWTMAKNQWNKLFEDRESVKTDEFIKKTSAAFRLQNQMESNAREALNFFFDSDSGSNNETNFFQFCALLSLFGPTETMFRKIGHFLQCPAALKDSLTYADVDDVKTPDENTNLNEFRLFSGMPNEKFFYNLPLLPTGQQYIADEDGNKYDSWLQVFETSIQEKVEEEANTEISKGMVPIEAA